MNPANLLVNACLLLLTACASGEPLPSADIIFIGENIVAVDAEFDNANAVAVRGEQIVAVGYRDTVLSYRGQETRIVDLRDRALVPGFIDAHGHITGVARAVDFVNLSSPPVGPVEDIDDLVRELSEYIEQARPKPGTWVLGYGYDDSLLAENRHPTREDLDRVSTTYPLAIAHVSFHLAAVNSTAITAVGIDEQTPDPAGGVIRRRPNSQEPNGVFEESAFRNFFGAIFLHSDAERLEWQLRRAADYYASLGITTAQEGYATPGDLAVLRDSAKRRTYPIDIVAFPGAIFFDDEMLGSFEAQQNYEGGVRVGGIKFSLDGSVQGRTAYLTEPFTKPPPGMSTDYRAYPTYPAEALNRHVIDFIDRGVPMLIHANGDAAIDMVIDAVKATSSQAAQRDHRTVVIHAQVTREDQLHRFAELGLIPSYFSAHPFFWGDWHRQILGNERAAFISPVARTAELGIPFTIHNDAPVVPADMMRLMWVTVNRKTRSGHVLGADQRATPMQALYAMTLGAAYQYFEEDRKGSIAPGKQADLVILDANPLAVDADAIQDIRVVETFARGRSVWP